MSAAWASMVAQLIGDDAACYLPPAGRPKRHRPSDKPPHPEPPDHNDLNPKGNAMTATDKAIRSHMHAAAELVQLILQQVRADDPQGARDLADAYKAGAMLQLRSTLAASGIAVLAVEVIEPNGTTHTLSKCELQREVMQ